MKKPARFSVLMALYLGGFLVFNLLVVLNTGFDTALLIYLAVALLIVVLCWIRHLYSRQIGVSLGLVIILQPPLAYFSVFEPPFKHLPPDMVREINVVGDILKGISGRQRISTDAMGFRTTAKPDYSGGAPNRIFMIGGSTTEQIFIDDARTTGAILQSSLGRKFGGVEVINTGVSGLRARQHLDTLKVIVRFGPKLVVFMMGVNDWNNHISQSLAAGSTAGLMKHFNLLVYFDLARFPLSKAAERLVSLARGRDRIAAPVEVVTENGDFYLGKRDALFKRPQARTFRPETVSADYASTVTDIFRVCRDNGLKCLFTNQPNGYSRQATRPFLRSFWMTPPRAGTTQSLDDMIYISALYNSWLEKAVCDAGHYFVDLDSKLPKSFEIFYDDVHFNTLGARRVAELLLPHVDRILSAPQGMRVVSPACS